MAVSGIHYGRVGGSVVQQGWAVADIVTTVEVGGLLRALGDPSWVTNVASPNFVIKQLLYSVR